MVFDAVGLDRQKRAQSDVQQHFDKLNAFIFQFVYEPFRKMQSRCRRGGRTAVLGVHRLISVLVF